MKALSIRQPWANQIARGEKTIEIRTWSTRYRGDLLIVSSKQGTEPPLGCAVAIATLVDCRPMTEVDEQAACCEMDEGDIAWVLENIRPVENVPIKGKLGIYEVPDDLVKVVD